MIHPPLKLELRAVLLTTSLLVAPAIAQDAGTVPGASNAPRPSAPNAPSATVGQPASQTQTVATNANSTVAAREAEEAARVMEQELQPKPNGLTASEIVTAAFDNSPNLRKATLEYDRAAANRARAKLAFAPRIDLQLGYTHLSKITQPSLSGLFGGGADAGAPMGMEMEGANAQPAARSPFTPILNQYSASARINLPITDIFLTIIPQYKGVEKLASAVNYQREAQKLQVAYDARVGFYEYARGLGNEAVARASVRVREAGVRELEALVQAGTATQTELVRAQAELANARVLATQAAGAVDIARERLEQLAGVEIDPSRGIGEPFVDIEIGETPNAESVLSTARQNRPELLAMVKLEQARELLLRSRKGAMFPKLSAGAGVLSARPNQRYIPPVDEFRTTWDVGVTAAWSPNDAVFAYTQATDAETDLKTVREDRRLLDQGIAVEATAAVVSHRTAVESIAAKRQQLEAARRYEADQRALLLAGAATPNDVLLAQRDLLAASLQWVDSFIAGRIAQAALIKAQGSTGLANTGPGSAP